MALVVWCFFITTAFVFLSESLVYRHQVCTTFNHPLDGKNDQQSCSLQRWLVLILWLLDVLKYILFYPFHFRNPVNSLKGLIYSFLPHVSKSFFFYDYFCEVAQKTFVLMRRWWVDMKATDVVIWWSCVGGKFNKAYVDYV